MNLLLCIIKVVGDIHLDFCFKSIYVIKVKTKWNSSSIVFRHNLQALSFLSIPLYRPRSISKSCAEILNCAIVRLFFCLFFFLFVM